MIIFVNCNWVATRWQCYSTHLHTNNAQNNTKILEVKCWPCPIFAGFTLAFALQPRKKHGKTSVRVAEGIKCFYGLNDRFLPHACLITGYLKSIINTSLKARV
jgi:hypothetical protein